MQNIIIILKWHAKTIYENEKKEFLLPKTHTRETVTSIQKIIFEPTKKNIFKASFTAIHSIILQ